MRKLIALAVLTTASTCQAAQYVDVPLRPVYGEISDPVQPVRSTVAVVVRKTTKVVNQVCKNGKCSQVQSFIEVCEDERCGQSFIQGIASPQITRSPVVVHPAKASPVPTSTMVNTYSSVYVPRVSVGGMTRGSIVEAHLLAEHGVANPPNGIDAWKLHDQLHPETPTRTTYNGPVRRFRLFRK